MTTFSIKVIASTEMEVNGEQEYINTTFSFDYSDATTFEDLETIAKDNLLDQWTDEHATPVDVENVTIEVDSPEDWDGIPEKYRDLTSSDFWEFLEACANSSYDSDIIEAALECGISASDVDGAYSGTYSSDEDFARETAEQLGYINEKVSWPYTCIDWEYAAKELMYDYSEHNGHYFRNF